MSKPSYHSIELITAEMKALAEANDWEAVALLIPHLKVDALPRAMPADREVIEMILANIAAVSERAEPLREDIARLLAGFSGSSRKA